MPERLEDRTLLSGISLLKDVNTQTLGSGPHDLVAVGSTLYFVANDASANPGLWKSDGTEAGTVLVKSVNIQNRSDNGPWLVPFNSKVYFSAYDSATGYELWSSDGTAAGTAIVKDIESGIGSSTPRYLAAMGSKLYFQATTSTNGAELWATDGTSAGTVLVKDIVTGSSASSPTNLTAAGSTLYFSATTSANGVELWKSDGTSAGTVLLKDIVVGTGSSSPASLTAVGSKLFFTATTSTTGRELYVSDGTTAGTVLLKDIYSGTNGSGASSMTSFNGSLYFFAQDATTGWQPYKSDGTTAGTVMIKNISSPYSGSSNGLGFTAMGSLLYFSAIDPNLGAALYVTDGTSAGTQRLKVIDTALSTDNLGSMTAVGSTLYFSATTKTQGRELWKSDGTAAGTVIVTDLFPGTVGSSPSYLTAVGSTLYFAAQDPAAGLELLKSDGTAAGTVVVKDIISGRTEASFPSGFVTLGGTLLFAAGTPLSGSELWKSDGTAAGTTLLADIAAGSADSFPTNLTVVGTTVYFLASSTGSGARRDLWKTDGTSAGTVLVATLNVATATGFQAIGSNLYFLANGSLWRSDGTAAGTVIVKSVSNAASLTLVGSTLYFTGADPTYFSTELWKSDGTTAGTTLVKDIYPGSGSSNPTSLTAVGSKLFFVANDGTTGPELWSSDGTAAGTAIVKDIFPSSGSSPGDPSSLKAVGSKLFFTAYEWQLGYGTELWVSDGTAAGTTVVKDIYPGGTGSSPGAFTAMGSRLFFTAYSPTAGTECWVSDGTAAGTNLIKDITAGSQSSADSASPLAIGSTVYFNALSGGDDGLWRTDGTAAGTFQVADLTPGTSNSGVSPVAAFNTASFQGLVVTGTNGTTGIEPWIYKYNEAPNALSLAGSTVNENAPAGTNVGTLSATDPDTGDTLSYALVAGPGSTDNASFQLTGTSLKLAAPLDYEAQPTYSIRVRVTDAGGLSLDRNFTITALNVNETPTDIALSPSSIPENQPAGTTVGSLSTSDPDAGDSFTYTFVTGIGSTDNAAFSIVGNALKANGTFDFETKSSYSVRVRTTDAGGLSFEKSFNVLVTNVNESPTDLALSGNSIPENQPAGTTVGSLSTNDPDAGDSFTYTLVAGIGSDDNAAFSIVGNALKANGGFDYETKSSYSVRVRTTDAGGLSFEKSFTVLVTNVNESPTDIALSPSSIPENQPAGTTVGNLSTSDPDAGDSFTYTLVTGIGSTDNAAFSIAGNALKANGGFDYETKSSYSVRVRTTDAGGLSFEKSFTVLVTNVNESPTDIALSPSSIPENQPAGTAVGNLSTNDPDAGDSFTYTLVAGIGSDDNAAFSIVGNALKANSGFDFETKSSYSVRVRTTDAGGLSFEKSFTVLVTDVNEGPKAVADSAATTDRQAVVIHPLQNDTDPDLAHGDVLTIISVGTPSVGTVSFNGTDITYTPVTNQTGSVTFPYTIRDQGGLTSTADVTVQVTDVTAPTVVDVRVRYGSQSYSIMTGTRTLPWFNINAIDVVFSESIDFAGSAVSLTGKTIPTYAPTLSIAGNKATLGLPTALDIDRLLLALDGATVGSAVHDLSGNTMGSNFSKGFNVLPGDFNGDGVVTTSDAVSVGTLIGIPVSATNLFGDVNGDGVITLADYNLVKSRIGRRLPPA